MNIKNERIKEMQKKLESRDWSIKEL
ncbi:MAG: hypothetical protein DRI87_05380 [Bacteroidetes bacterium]|nr:MAG: hypothetical protein DRI87_05380 [Bacteroidota bacterium]